MKKVSPIIHCSMAEVKMAPILNVVLRRHKTEQKRAAPCERKIKNDLPSSAVGQHLVKNRNFDEILKNWSLSRGLLWQILFPLGPFSLV